MFEIALNGSLDKFLTRISLHLPKEALNALRKYNLQSERTFETPCSIKRVSMGCCLLRLSAKILAHLRLSVNFFQLRLTKKLKINFFVSKS